MLIEHLSPGKVTEIYGHEVSIHDSANGIFVISESEPAFCFMRNTEEEAIGVAKAAIESYVKLTAFS